MVKVFSQNQSGGITAESVNIVSQSSAPKSFDPILFAKKHAIKLLITAFFTIILGSLFSNTNNLLGGSDMEKKVEVNAEVVSVNQSGGITAKNVVINQKNERHLTESLQEQLFSLLPEKNTPITISVIANDLEAYAYAEEIALFLEANGWMVNKPFSVWMMTVEPLIGQQITADGTSITIGKNPLN